MAINMLAVQHCLPLLGDEVEIRADEEPTDEWMQSLVKLTLEQLNPTKELKPPIDAKTRGEFARRWWNTIRGNPWKPYARKTPIDADGHGVKDQDDALPLDAKNASLSVAGMVMISGFSVDPWPSRGGAALHRRGGRSPTEQEGEGIHDRELQADRARGAKQLQQSTQV